MNLLNSSPVERLCFNLSSSKSSAESLLRIDLILESVSSKLAESDVLVVLLLLFAGLKNDCVVVEVDASVEAEALSIGAGGKFVLP